jgi:uncharacterized protein YlzI (FlbEa/FlbD family)
MEYFDRAEINGRDNKAIFINPTLIESIEQVDLVMSSGIRVTRIRMTSGKEHIVEGSVTDVARQLFEEF